MLTIGVASVMEKSQCLQQLASKHTNTVDWHNVDGLGTAVLLDKMY